MVGDSEPERPKASSDAIIRGRAQRLQLRVEQRTRKVDQRGVGFIEWGQLQQADHLKPTLLLLIIIMGKALPPGVVRRCVPDVDGHL